MTSSDEEPLLKPSDLLAYKRASGQLPEFPAPRAVIFMPQKSVANRILRRHPSRQIRGFLGEFLLLKRTGGKVALSTGFGVGAPAIGSLTDEFAALGVKQFLLIGLAGALQPELSAGSLVLATRALHGEGVSRHYLPPHPTVQASEELVQGLSRILAKQNLPQASGTVWTTDAPFRELRGEVLAHQEQGVLAVDMEAAAMLSVAQANGCSAVAAFSIADSLSGGRWRMEDDSRLAQEGVIALFEAALELLLKDRQGI
jgi:uridine phosphorylase